MTIGPNGPWYSCLPECESLVPCGIGRHPVRWVAGSLRLPEHPDAEGELVLAALGGEKAGCIELAEAWGRHGTDLSVLAIGPRHPADEIPVSWDDVAAASQSGQRLPGATTQPRPQRLASQAAGLQAMASARRRLVSAEMEQTRQRRNDILSLLALGYGFQVRLIGQVAAAHAALLDDRAPGSEAARPALVAAITGRLAPAAEQWLGIDPDQVVVSVHQGPGWGSAELTGRGEERRLRISLPPGWLAQVWACGLTLTGRHLVVAVEQHGWPRARVLAVRAPGTDPVVLDVQASLGAADTMPDAPHWEPSPG